MRIYNAIAQPVQPADLPSPHGYLCDWGDSHSGLTRQTFYYAEPGCAIADDWNEHPKLANNVPMYTASQMQLLIAAINAQRSV